MTGRAPRIAVVGGGLAGITAALDCAEGGAQVTLLEVRPRLGGAAYSYERDGLRIDNGQHVFLRCCGAYRALLRRIGSDGDVVLQPRLDIPVLVPGRRPARLSRTRLPAPLQLSASMARFPLLSAAGKVRVARAMLALRSVDPDDPFADARSFGDWLAEHDQGAEEIEAVWRLIGLPTLNVDPAEASLAQAAYVFRTALLEHSSAADIGWARVPLSDLHDGPSQRALAAAGAEVRLGARIERVVARPGAGFLVEGPADGIEADAVVVALPSQRVAGLLPPGALADPAALERLGRSPIVNLHVAYDRRVLHEPFAVAARSPVQWLFDRTDGSGVEHGQLVAVSLSGADEEAAMDADALRERFVPALAELLPAARGARVERFLVTREHAATFRPGPGVRSVRPGPRTGMPGLALAGAWTDTGWPATMESAVRSGHAAAREALTAARAAAGAVTAVAA
ncbi:hydroxysqualene dehydroxylase HpnE [Capillimicrobium parvum]|uniref:Hydroxysqualene dehydroxylase n=1 Tax=Capillimicrobium parvum TaxID=2884022 RepID=A0A9E7C2P6_9ACTN|nr:hydroxysqualene dehydroxylase HpnE [Capillimicrobium parvum]UGS38775.1 Hydroxysqualene dehydroxylase [Capillimicrobium parvum]